MQGNNSSCTRNYEKFIMGVTCCSRNCIHCSFVQASKCVTHSRATASQTCSRSSATRASTAYLAPAWWRSRLRTTRPTSSSATSTNCSSSPSSTTAATCSLASASFPVRLSYKLQYYAILGSPLKDCVSWLHCPIPYTGNLKFLTIA